MVNWVKQVSDVMGAVNQRWDTAKKHVARQFGIQDPIHIMSYVGYGTSE